MGPADFSTRKIFRCNDEDVGRDEFWKKRVAFEREKVFFTYEQSKNRCWVANAPHELKSKRFRVMNEVKLSLEGRDIPIEVIEWV